MAEEAYEESLLASDRYVEAQFALQDVLKEGAFELARARYALGGQASVSRIGFNPRHERGVRVNGTLPEHGSGAALSVTVDEGDNQALLRHFSPLPPPSLRQAQKHFQRAIRLATEAAKEGYTALSWANELALIERGHSRSMPEGLSDSTWEHTPDEESEDGQSNRTEVVG